MKADFFARNGFVRSGDLVFDVGVRDGKVTREFLELGATVVCVEPKPEHVEQMRAIFGEHITVVEAAVMDETGEGVLYERARKFSATMRPDLYWPQSGGEADEFSPSRTVATVTLDELVARFGFPTFIKLDIEASEYWALKGLTYPVPALCFEFGSSYIEEAYKCVELLGADYVFNYVEGHHGDWMSYWAPANDFTIDLPEKDERDKWTWGNVFARRVDETD